MVVHILLGQARDDLTEVERQELAAAIDSLQHVTGVQNMSSGVNISDRSKGFTHGAVMHFESRDTLQAYLIDEEHVRLSKIIVNLAPNRLIVDYEAGSSGISS